MTTVAGAPAGYRGTRAEILMALKKAQPLTAKELADRFGVTPNALRRHLKELENEGIVCYSREIHGVGGPVFAFSLTEAGEALFPRAYERALTEILDLVREQQGDDGVVQLFQRRWDEIARVARPELERLPVEQRATRLAELLTSLGYMAEARPVVGALPVLTEHNCAIRLIAERFPEVCAAEERFIADLLGAPVTRQAHIAKGANCCEYCIAIETEGAEGAKGAMGAMNGAKDVI
jgi:DeoR family transcriptional regulator, suf operon transcriptional repressor